MKRITTVKARKRRKKSDKTKATIYTLLVIGLTIYMCFLLLADLINIGMKMREIHYTLEIAFYVLAGALVYFFIINPLFTILFAPTFPLGTVYAEDSPEWNRGLKRIAKNLIRHNIPTPEQEQNLLEIFESEGDLKGALQAIMEGKVKGDVNKIIVESARNVMFMTALSQNSSLDMLSVLINAMAMIKKIVIRCGFRPTYIKLMKLFSNVLVTALIADGLERVGLETVFQSLKGVKGLLLGSLSEGLMNGFLMLRLGMVARNYIFSEGREIIREEIRRSAILEAAKVLPHFVAEVVTIIPRTIINYFKKDPLED